MITVLIIIAFIGSMVCSAYGMYLGIESSKKPNHTYIHHIHE